MTVEKSVVELDGLMAERTEIGLVEQTVVDWADWTAACSAAC